MLMFVSDQSRKRGTLESDLLMSTFADAHLPNMTLAQMAQYDLFLDENDWDIYYWATQELTPTSRETAEGAGAGPEGATAAVQGKDMSSPVAQEVDHSKETRADLDAGMWRQGRARSGEWAQTIGAFKPAYRPVPARWRNSEILAKLRHHVLERSAGGIHESEALSRTVKGTSGGGKIPWLPILVQLTNGLQVWRSCPKCAIWTDSLQPIVVFLPSVTTAMELDYAARAVSTLMTQRLPR